MLWWESIWCVWVWLNLLVTREKVLIVVLSLSSLPQLTIHQHSTHNKTKNKSYIMTGGVLSQCLTIGVISHPLNIGNDNSSHVSSVYFQCVSVPEYRRSISWEKRASETFSFPSLFSAPHSHVNMCGHTRAVFDTDACAMLRIRLIEVDMRKAEAVVANWDKWSWWWSRDKQPVSMSLQQRHGAGAQEHNVLHMTHTVWLNVSEAELQLASHHQVL